MSQLVPKRAVNSDTKKQMIFHAPPPCTPTLTFWRRSFIFNSNKSPTWCNSFSVYYPETFVYSSTCFGAFSRPSPGAQWLQWQPLVLPSYRGDSRTVVRGRAGRKTPDTCWAVNKGQDNKLENCCIRLVIWIRICVWIFQHRICTVKIPVSWYVNRVVW